MGPPPVPSKSKVKGKAAPLAGEDAQGVPMDVDNDADAPDDENPEEFDPSEDPPEEEFEDEDEEELVNQVAAEEEQLKLDARGPEDPQDVDTEIV